MSVQTQAAVKQRTIEDELPNPPVPVVKLQRVPTKQDTAADSSLPEISESAPRELRPKVQDTSRIRPCVGEPHATQVPMVARPTASPAAAEPRRLFPVEEYASNLDPGSVKARYQVGPTDPTILFIGDLDERHGPDLLVRSMPPILKNHPQARLIIVGDGPLLWPLRVMSRYMLLDYAIRIVGHVGGRSVRELIAAADVVAVPSRVPTEDWQILSGWSAHRPVIATYEAAGDLCKHDENSVLIYANPGSCVWGVERVLFDPEFSRLIGERGYQKVVTEFTRQQIT